MNTSIEPESPFLKNPIFNLQRISEFAALTSGQWKCNDVVEIFDGSCLTSKSSSLPLEEYPEAQVRSTSRNTQSRTCNSIINTGILLDRSHYRQYKDTYKKCILNPGNTELRLDLARIEDNLPLSSIVMAREQGKIEVSHGKDYAMHKSDINRQCC